MRSGTERLQAKSIRIPLPRFVPTVRTVQYHDFPVVIRAQEATTHLPFPVCLILLLPALIGTHEDLQDTVTKNPDSSFGWDGTPVVIAAQDHDRLFERLGEGVHVLETLPSYGELGILDGNHRRNKAENLDLQRIPAQLVPLRSSSIVIGSWDGNQPPNKEDVVACFSDKNKVYPPKSTKFQIIGLDGNLRRFKEYQPLVQIPMTGLR